VNILPLYIFLMTDPDELLPPEAFIIRLDKPYLWQPLVDGHPVSRLSEKAGFMLAET
jgi:hypothetical protein